MSRRSHRRSTLSAARDLACRRGAAVPRRELSSRCRDCRARASGQPVELTWSHSLRRDTERPSAPWLVRQPNHPSPVASDDPGHLSSPPLPARTRRARAQSLTAVGSLAHIFARWQNANLAGCIVPLRKTEWPGPCKPPHFATENHAAMRFGNPERVAELSGLGIRIYNIAKGSTLWRLGQRDPVSASRLSSSGDDPPKTQVPRNYQPKILQQ